MQWTAVVNPTAGRGRTRRLLPRLRAALEDAGIAVHVSGDAAEGATIARAACARGDGIVACGGDGTVAALAGIAAETRGVLAVVPTGAGNDLARHLGIGHRRPLDAVALPADPERAGSLQPVDLGRATAADGTTRWFTTVANVGFDAEANRWANGVRWATGTPLYVLAMLRTLVAYRPQPITVRVDGQERSGAMWLVAVGNTRCYAGGMQITPDARVDDGLLDVCVIGTSSRFELVTRFPSVFRGRHPRAAAVEILRGKAIELSSTGALELWASGERVGPLPATVDVIPAAIQVLIPRC